MVLLDWWSMTSGTPNSKRAAYGRKRERFGKITFDNKTNQSWSSCLSGLISLATPATSQPTSTSTTSTTSTPFWGTLWKRPLFNGNVNQSNFPAKIEPTATILPSRIIVHTCFGHPLYLHAFYFRLTKTKLVNHGHETDEAETKTKDSTIG